jgi:hypothetical protein
MFDFKNYAMKTVSKFPGLQLVRLQGKLKLTEKEKIIYSYVFIEVFKIPMY